MPWADADPYIFWAIALPLLFLVVALLTAWFERNDR